MQEWRNRLRWVMLVRHERAGMSVHLQGRPHTGKGFMTRILRQVMLLSRALGRAVLLLLVLACGESNTPSPGESPCPDDLVTVRVENGQSATPRFLWTPACPVALLQVSALAPASDITWSIGGRLLNVIGSGVTYGELPFGAELGEGPLPLEVGVSYEVRVVEGADGVGLAGGGNAVFTR